MKRTLDSGSSYQSSFQNLMPLLRTCVTAPAAGGRLWAVQEGLCVWGDRGGGGECFCLQYTGISELQCSLGAVCIVWTICALIRFSRESFFYPWKGSVDIRLIAKSVGLWNCSGVDTKGEIWMLLQRIDLRQPAFLLSCHGFIGTRWNRTSSPWRDVSYLYSGRPRSGGWSDIDCTDWGLSWFYKIPPV